MTRRWIVRRTRGRRGVPGLRRVLTASLALAEELQAGTIGKGAGQG